MLTHRPVVLVLAVLLSGSVTAQPSPTLTVLDPGGLEGGDAFGAATAVDGDWAIAGAPGDDDLGTDIGAAYVFQRSGGQWALFQKLVQADESFGSAVAVDGATLAVSAPKNPGGDVYLYVFDGTQWGLTQKLHFYETDYDDSGAFGTDLQFDGDRLAVGGPSPEGTSYRGGIVNLYEREGAPWIIEQKVISGSTTLSYRFGSALALDGDRLLVGAPIYPCCFSPDGPVSLGNVYYYVREEGSWRRKQQFSSSAGTDGRLFGNRLAMDGDRALVSGQRVGAQEDSSVVYAFEFQGDEWVETQAFSGDPATTRPGSALAIRGDRMVIGDAHASEVRLYRHDGLRWVESSRLGGVPGSAFGAALSLGSGDLLIGAPDEASEAGAVYSVELDPITPTASILVDGPRGVRFLGTPSSGLTVDDLAAQNLVRGVPGYYPAVPRANLFAHYDADKATWLPSSGTGEELRLGYAFRWTFFDNAVGDPDISVSRPLPFALATYRPVNTDDVTVDLNTSGSRWNYLANPFGRPVDLTEADTWPGYFGISSPAYVYDPVTRSWEDAPTVIEPWGAVRVRSKGPRIDGSGRTLRIPASAQVPAGGSVQARRAADFPSIAFRLDGTDRDGLPLADAAFTVAFDEAATPGLDAEVDVEKLQTPATAYVLVGSRVGDAFLGYDVRPFSDAEVPLALDLRGAASDLTLRWDASSMPADLPVMLVDLVTGEEVDVRRDSEIDFRSDAAPALGTEPQAEVADPETATDRFVLRIGERVATAGETPGPLALRLDTPRPNPSAGSARVAFALPEASVVRLTVVDARGREVETLVDRSMAASRHDVEIDVAALAAGVYVVRLAAGGDVQTRRLVVVR